MLKILTLNWNGKAKLERLYPSLVKSLSGVDYQWFIKDNGSTDGSVSFVKSLNDEKVSLLEWKHNQDTFSLGCNILFHEANANDEDLVLLLNNDVCFNDTESLNKMISILNNNEDVGVVGAKLKYTNTNKLQHAGVVFYVQHGFPGHFRANENDDKLSSMNREFQAVTGAVLLTKAKYYSNICRSNKSGLNGLDENFIWAFEDISACLSIKYEQNKRVIYCGGTDIFHEESASLKKNPQNKLFLQNNLVYFRSKWKNKYQIDQLSYLSNPTYNIVNI